jgi:hypothetical protein
MRGENRCGAQKSRAFGCQQGRYQKPGKGGSAAETVERVEPKKFDLPLEKSLFSVR